MLKIGARAAVLAFMVVVTAAASVHASCIGPPAMDEQIASADVVFVGTVRALADRDRRATFVVIEQWRGEPLQGIVQVEGGTGDPNSGSSADRAFVARAKYLVAATLRDGRLYDNACSATAQWEPAFAAFRPADAWTPAPATDETSDLGIGVPLIVALGAGVVILIVGLIAFRQASPVGTEIRR